VFAFGLCCVVFFEFFDNILGREEKILSSIFGRLRDAAEQNLIIMDNNFIFLSCCLGTEE
jgi:hypothetical protein